jgi:hypothetical protein
MGFVVGGAIGINPVTNEFLLQRERAGTWYLAGIDLQTGIVTEHVMLDNTFISMSIAIEYESAHTISGTITDEDGSAVEGVTIRSSDGSSTGLISGTYTLTDLFSGTYTLTPTLSGYTFDPASLTVSVPPDATGQDFTAIADTPPPPTDGFQVDRDGFNFGNFRYYGADWEHFKKTFPATRMELPSGERRKGPERYFYSWLYSHVGDGGNCAGFTAVSLLHFLNLAETVEPDLLLPEHHNLNPLYDWPEPLSEPFTLRESDIADYIHLYQARQLSWQFNQWWFAQGHAKDIPQEVFQGITQHTQNNEPVAIDIFQAGQGGHRMTAYRTKEDGNTGSIYVYDSNWPGDDTRRIEINLLTGQWSYALSPNRTWSGTSNIRYSPGMLNFPASLPWWHDTDNMLQADVISGTHLGIEGDAALLITDDQGRRLGFENGDLISEIPGAGYVPIYAFNLENPDAPLHGEFFIPEGTDYTVAITPTDTGTYTLTAFANNSAMSLDNIEITSGSNDTLTMNDGVRDAAFDPATDDEYCHYVTLEVSATASRDYTSCVTGEGAAAFNLDETDGSLTISNNGTQAITVAVTIDQVGDDAHTNTVNQTIGPGESVTLSRDAGGTWTTAQGDDPTNNIYLPLIRR